MPPIMGFLENYWLSAELFVSLQHTTVEFIFEITGAGIQLVDNLKMEFDMMLQLRHPHVLQMIGFVSDESYKCVARALAARRAPPLTRAYTNSLTLTSAVDGARRSP